MLLFQFLELGASLLRHWFSSDVWQLLVMCLLMMFLDFQWVNAPSSRQGITVSSNYRGAVGHAGLLNSNFYFQYDSIPSVLREFLNFLDYPGIPLF